MPLSPLARPAQLVWYARAAQLTTLGLICGRGVLNREFQGEPVNLVSVRDSVTRDVREGHILHTLPNLIRESDAATALWARSRGAPSRLLALGRTYQSVSVVVRRDSPIETLKDIAGFRWSVPVESGPFSPALVRAHRAWYSLTDYLDLPLEQSRLTEVATGDPMSRAGHVGEQELGALIRRETDVALLFGAKGLEQARHPQVREVYRFSPSMAWSDPRLSGLVELRAVSVDEGLLDADPRIVRRILRRLVEASLWANAFPSEAYVQAAYETGVYLNDATQAYAPLIGESAALSLNFRALKDLDALSQFMATLGHMALAVDCPSWAAPNLLSEILANLPSPSIAC